MKKHVSVSAPGKLMLFGEHSVVYGHPCIVTAVDQRIFCKAEFINGERLLKIDAQDVDVKGYKKPLDQLGNGDIPKGARFVEIAVKNFFEKFEILRLIQNHKKSLHILTKSEFKSTFGFGSSSASTVCVIKVLSELFNIQLSEKEIFDLSYKTVLDIQGSGSGFDVASAIYGGTIYFQNKGEMILPLYPSELPLVIGYSGIKADTVTLIQTVAKLGIEKPDFVEEIFQKIDHIVEKAKRAIEESDFETLGDLMNQNQELLRKLTVSTEKLDTMITAATNAGAYGAKLSGAGGGDCIIAITENSTQKTVQHAIEKNGGEIMNVRANAEGVRVEK